MTIKEILRERLKLYLECEKKILLNQSYTIGNRIFRRADLEDVRKVIDDLIDSGVTLEDDETARLVNGRSRRVVFID